MQGSIFESNSSVRLDYQPLFGKIKRTTEIELSLVLTS